jgi:hypothetical protein
VRRSQKSCRMQSRCDSWNSYCSTFSFLIQRRERNEARVVTNANCPETNLNVHISNDLSASMRQGATRDFWPGRWASRAADSSLTQAWCFVDQPACALLGIARPSACHLSVAEQINAGRVKRYVVSAPGR